MSNEHDVPAHEEGTSHESDAVPNQPEDSATAAVTEGAENGQTPKPKSKKKLFIILVIALVVLLVAGGLGWWLVTPSTDDNYWESLNEQGLDGEYINQEIAVAQGKGFCDQVAAGTTTEAFWYQKTAVDFYCPEYAEAIKVVPTEQEQDEAYLKDLRAADLGGEFASDAAAISSGRAVCTRLDEGGENQGPPVELIAVENYCPEYAGGFRELTTFEVVGTFTLYSDDYLCVGGGIALSGGYDDIGAGTDVKWENGNGDRLATTNLGEDSESGRDSCEWTFTSQLPEGEDIYVLSVGRRGTQEYTEAELKVPGTVALSLGSPF